MFKFMALVTLYLTFPGREGSDHVSYYSFVGLSTHYQSYHDAFDQVLTLNNANFAMCVASVENLRSGTQEDFRFAFKYNIDSQACQVGKVPFQLVRVVRDLGTNKNFVDNGSPEKLFIWVSGLKDFTKLAVLGIEGSNDVIDLSSEARVCSWLPTTPFASWRMKTLVWHNDYPVLCAGLENGIAQSTCFKLTQNLMSWEQLPQPLEYGRNNVRSLQRDFNDFLIIGGLGNPEPPAIFSSWQTVVENFKDGQVNPNGQTTAPSPFNHDSSYGFCHVQLSVRLHFFAGYRDGSEVVGLWNTVTGNWTTLKNEEQNSTFLLICGSFRNVHHGGQEVALITNNVFEIYNPESKTKRTGNLSNFSRNSISQVVQFKDHFVIVGGYVNGAINTDIHKFDPLLEDFVLLPQKFSFERDKGHLVAIPDSMAICANN